MVNFGSGFVLCNVICFSSSFNIYCSCFLLLVILLLLFQFIRFVIGTFIPIFFIEISFVYPPPPRRRPSSLRKLLRRRLRRNAAPSDVSMSSLSRVGWPILINRNMAQWHNSLLKSLVFLWITFSIQQRFPYTRSLNRANDCLGRDSRRAGCWRLRYPPSHVTFFVLLFRTRSWLFNCFVRPLWTDQRFPQSWGVCSACVTYYINKRKQQEGTQRQITKDWRCPARE